MLQGMMCYRNQNIVYARDHMHEEMIGLAEHYESCKPKPPNQKKAK